MTLATESAVMPAFRFIWWEETISSTVKKKKKEEDVRKKLYYNDYGSHPSVRYSSFYPSLGRINYSIIGMIESLINLTASLCNTAEKETCPFPQGKAAASNNE